MFIFLISTVEKKLEFRIRFRIKQIVCQKFRRQMFITTIHDFNLQQTAETPLSFITGIRAIGRGTLLRASGF